MASGPARDERGNLGPMKRLLPLLASAVVLGCVSGEPSAGGGGGAGGTTGPTTGLGTGGAGGAAGGTAGSTTTTGGAGGGRTDAGNTGGSPGTTGGSRGGTSGGATGVGGTSGTGGTGTGRGGAGGATSATGGTHVASGGAGGAVTSTGGTGAGTGGARDGGAEVAGSSAIEQLETYLAIPRAQRPPLDGEPFAKTPLTRDEATRAAELLFADHAANLKTTRKSEHDKRAITLDGKTMRFAFKTFGSKPATGRSLFISLHGGGNAAASVNDEQWANQQTLYQPAEGIYLCPRAPTDTWNLWHEAHIDPMFERLIANLIVLEEVNPDRVYVMGYSAGGDGVYQLGPRMADQWAAAAAMAGHPNDAQPYSLRNIGFTIHVGALDTSYDRNLVAQEWDEKLDALEAAEPGSYLHVVEVHAGKPHWMDLEDAVAVPWMAKLTRDPMPPKLVWYQDDVPHTRFYWLAVEPAQAKAKTQIRGSITGQTIALESSNLPAVKVRLADGMLDLDRPVIVTANGAERWNASVSRTIALLAKTLDERGDPRQLFAAEVAVTF